MARQLSKVGGGGNISGVMETSTPFSHPQGNVNGRRVSMAPSKPTPLRIHVHRSQEVEWEEGDSEEDEEEQRRSMRLKRLRNLSLV